MAADLGLTRSHVFGAFACSQVVAGVLAPWAGRAVDGLGGRRVLVASALVAALGFVVLAQARSSWSLLAGWAIQGVAMALGLYDTCFAAIACWANEFVSENGHRRHVGGRLREHGLMACDALFARVRRMEEHLRPLCSGHAAVRTCLRARSATLCAREW